MAHHRPRAGRTCGTPLRIPLVVVTPGPCVRPLAKGCQWACTKPGRGWRAAPHTRSSPRTSPIPRASSAGSAWPSSRVRRPTRRRIAWWSWVCRCSIRYPRSGAARCGAGSPRTGVGEHGRHRYSVGPGGGDSGRRWADAAQLRSGGAAGRSAGRVRVTDYLAMESPAAPLSSTRGRRRVHLWGTVPLPGAAARGAWLPGGARVGRRSGPSGSARPADRTVRPPRSERSSPPSSWTTQ